MTEPRQSVFRLDNASPHLRARYKRFALVSHPDHVTALEPHQDDTLIVACNWLLWQRAAAQGLHCIHYESGLTGEDPENLMTQLYIKASDWVYVDGVDATVFHGVSLGRKFFKEPALVIFDHCKLTQTLAALMAKYRPAEIVFFDYRTDHVFLDPAGRLETVRNIADDFGATVTDRCDPPDQSDPHLALIAAYGAKFDNASGLMARCRRALMRTFGRAMEGISRLRRRADRQKPGVLLLTTHITSVPLLESHDGRGVVPMLLAGHFPRKRDIQFLLRSLAKGVQLLAQPAVRLSEGDMNRIDAIEAELGGAWSAPGEGVEGHVRRYVREQILAPGKLRELAITVVSAERILDRHEPDLVLTDGLQNPTYTAFLEIARNRGIKTAATLHGQYLNDMRLEIFGGDPRVAPLAEYCLTWGRAQEAWLAATNSKSITYRTGNPIAGQHFSEAGAKGRRGRVLVLQYAPLLQDLFAPQATQFSYFIDVVRMLRELGFDDICFRLHPGHTKIGYYRDVAAFFGIDCEISFEGPFKAVLDDAEFAIGPVTTGAMLEVLGTGKPYYPVLLKPHSLNTEYLRGSLVYGSIQALRDALASGAKLEQREMLNDFTSHDEIPDPATQMWQALRDGISKAAAQ